MLKRARKRLTMSKSSKISLDGWWMVQSTVAPSRVATVRRSLIIPMAESESKPEVGSSKNT